MPAVQFYSEQERASHPQGKLVNSFLMKTYFKDELTETQIELLGQNLGLIDFKTALSHAEEVEKLKLLICFFCAKGETDKILSQRFMRHLSAELIAKASALTGRLEIIEHLGISAGKRLVILQHSDIAASLISMEASQAFIDYLDVDISEEQKMKDFFIYLDYRRFYRLAALYVHIAILNHLQAIPGFDKLAAAEEEDYWAYKVAALNGHIAILNHLEAIPDFDKLAAGEASNYAAYCLAAQNGHKAILSHLEAIPRFNALAAAEADDYLAYRLAALNGHITILSHLEAIPGFNALAAAKASNYGAYRYASENGHEAILSHLEAIPDFVTLAAAEADYYAYGLAAHNGHEAILSHLEAIPGFNALAAVKDDNYAAYCLAAENGHIAILSHLEAIPGFNALAAAKADSYAAYCLAGQNGHEAILSYLEAIPRFNALAAAEADDYLAYRLAALNGHITILSHLEAIPGFNAFAAAKDDNYATYRHASQNGHKAILSHLVNFSHVLAYAEKHDLEYGEKHIYAYVSDCISGIKSQKVRYEEAHPNGEFDIEAGEGEHAFYLLRNLIRRGVARDYMLGRRGAEDLSDDIRFLLSMPSVKALCHQRGTVDEGSPGQKNELLRLANTIGNEEASSILLQLPDVRALAEAANFYADDARGGLDLRRLACGLDSLLEQKLKARPPATISIVESRHTLWATDGADAAATEPASSAPSRTFKSRG